MVEHKDRSTSKPLSVELTPDGLTPTRICNGEVQRTLMQVVPEHTCGQVSHGVEVVVGHHLRLTAGTRRKVHQHGILVAVDEGGLDELRCLQPF